MREEKLRENIKIHFGQGVYACEYCLDLKSGYCIGQGYQNYQQCAECVNKKYTEVGYVCSRSGRNGD